MTRYTPLWEQQGSYAASGDRRLIAAIWPTPASTGCAVSVASAMTVNVAPGAVAVPTPNATGSTLCASDALEQVTLGAAPASGLNRIDLVVCQARGNDLDGGANNDFIFTSVAGAAAATATVPATPAGAVSLAQILVPGGSASITAGNITDVRPWGLAIGSAAALPPPLGAGAPLASFTDGSGEVWIAKGGVNNGAWRKARDVLIGRWYRAAAYSWSISAVLFGFDAVTRDPYGLYGLGTFLFTAPIPGWYQVNGKMAVNGLAAHEYHTFIYRNAAEYAYNGGLYSQASYGQHLVFAGLDIYCAAGDTLGLYFAGTAADTGLPGADITYMSIAYKGTG